MARDEDIGPDRGITFETDDEENQAETVFEDDDHSESDFSSPNGSNNCLDPYSPPPWPQSYRQSMDMFSSVTPPTISFLKDASFALSSSFSMSRRLPYEYDPPLSKPLIDPPTIYREESEPVSERWTAKYSESAISKISIVTEFLPPTRQCSFAQATLNAINVMCGIGLLSTPYTIKEGGWLSVLLFVLFATIACYTGFLLKQCLDSESGLQTYPDIGQAAFGKIGRYGIAIILYMDLYACCVEYIIMMSDNLSSVFPNNHLEVAGFVLSSHQIFAILMTLVVLPTVWLRNLSLLSYLSAGGVITSLLLALCLLWVGVVDQVGFHPSRLDFSIATLPVTVGLAGFCYSGHSVFPNIYSSMKTPSQFPFVMISAFALCVFFYLTVGICGFMMFGEATVSQFTLNMPKQFVASKIAVWTSVFSPVTKYALTITPVALSLEELLPASQLKSHLPSVLIRTVLVVTTLVMALTVPFFATVMALIGSLLAMLMAQIFPCACYLSILRGKLHYLQIASCILIIIVGILCSVTGTYSAIKQLVDNMA